ncbi:DNA cytosine methyltransferase [Coleofasciculus sp. FACHB-712]|uniref:DNA cytosine methyltransferase n=1 Tax=Coleofasciculus sp. FACHB-712 TaxID=2692789 RepID=UPI001F548894|nr:DNA cytosine methyltransferase [Coleofasciculus sp. FACHB-712]
MVHFYRRPVAVDLFAGAGGFSLGIEQAGFDVAVAVEVDPVHAAVHAFNFPHTQVLCADARTLSAEAIRKALQRWALRKGSSGVSPPAPAWNGEIDLAIGGPPCQGFSLMGKRRLDDERNDLVLHFCRLVIELQPRYFLMENVPGIAQKEHAIYLEQLKSAFKSVEYHITEPVQVLNAADFGVPQNRKRLFLLGTRAGEVPLSYPVVAGFVAGKGVKATFPDTSFPDTLFPDTSFPDISLPKTSLPKKRGKKKNPLSLHSLSFRVTVKDAIADLPNLDDFPELLTTDEVLLQQRQLEQMETLASIYAQHLMGIAPEPNNFAYPRLVNPHLLTSSLRTQHTAASIERFEKTVPGQLESVSRFRRLNWDTLSHTLRAGTGSGGGRYTSPRPIHPTYPRVISVREAARLHSFPDWFRFHTTKWHGFRQIGNAVPPKLARAVGYQVIAALGIRPPMPQQPINLGDIELVRFNPWDAAHYWISVNRHG